MDIDLQQNQASYTELAARKGTEKRERAVGRLGEIWGKITKAVDTVVGFSDKDVQNVFWAEISGGLEDAERGTKKFLREVDRELLKAVNQTCEVVNEGIEDRVKAMESKAREMVRGPINAIGRGVIAPMVQEIYKPAVRFIDVVSEKIARAQVLALEVGSAPGEVGYRVTRAITESPSAKWIRDTQDTIEQSNDNKGLFESAIIGWLDKWINRGVTSSRSFLIEQVSYLNAADRIREEFLKGRGIRKAMHDEASQEVDKLKRGII